MIEISIISSALHLQIPLGNEPLEIGSKPVASRRSVKLVDAGRQSVQIVLRPIIRAETWCLQIENLGDPIILSDGSQIDGRSLVVHALPVAIHLEDSNIYAFDSACDIDPFHEIIRTLPALRETIDDAQLIQAISVESLGVAPSSSTLHQWFESLGRLQRSIAGTNEFFAEAARAVLDPGGLDAGMILVYDQSEWSIAGSQFTSRESEFWFRRSILDELLQTKRTIFHDASRMGAADLVDGQSMIVASPIFNEEHIITGAVYGLRLHHAKNQRRGIRPLEAQFVQLVADSVTAGLIRLRREAEIARTQVMFEQVFAPKVALELQRNPQILDGHEREVTMLFCDLRGFSRIAEQLGSKATYELLGDVMEFLTAQVIQHDGVIIDYFGDGMSAFWNAPIDQPNHPLLACRAAWDMLSGFPQLCDDWRPLVGHAMQIGIGIHTGVAQVGNAGSTRRLKYGPRGNAVNIASRLENATKRFGVPLLISQATANAVRDHFFTRRVCQTQLPGIEVSINIYEIFPASIDDARQEALRTYERSLAAFEKGQLERAGELLEAASQNHPLDPVASYLRKQIEIKHLRKPRKK